MHDIRKLSNDDLVRELKAAVSKEREMTIHVLHRLNEVERRRLHLDGGYSSLHVYCVRHLKYSSSAAARRISAARCIRRYPEVLAMLKKRELSLSTISLIAPVLKHDETILERVREASHRQVEKIVAQYGPPVALRDRVRPVRVATPGAGSEDKLFVQFLADENLVELFEEVKELMSRDGKNPSIADVLKTVLTEYRDRHSPAARKERRDAKEVHSRRREWKDAPQARHIPDEIRDEVFARDGGKCTFTANDGTRCESKKGVQLDHIVPYSAGGTHEPSNLRLLCAAHNRRAAELRLGTHVTGRYWRSP
jgi:5-methylcytosine-specific restriction endonuclease McrA